MYCYISRINFEQNNKIKSYADKLRMYIKIVTNIFK